MRFNEPFEHVSIVFWIGHVQVELLDSNDAKIKSTHNNEPNDEVEKRIVDEIQETFEAKVGVLVVLEVRVD